MIRQGRAPTRKPPVTAAGVALLLAACTGAPAQDARRFDLICQAEKASERHLDEPISVDLKTMQWANRSQGRMPILRTRGEIVELVSGDSIRHSLDLKRLEDLQQIGGVRLVGSCRKLPFSNLRP